MNYYLTGKTVKFLSIDDIILPTDYCRLLNYEQSPYKDENYDCMKWQLVKDDLTVWCGKSYREFLELFYETSNITKEMYQHEIVRVIE